MKRRRPSKTALMERIQVLQEALDYIDGHGCDDDSRIAEVALRGSWVSPGCCPGHGYVPNDKENG